MEVGVIITIMQFNLYDNMIGRSVPVNIFGPKIGILDIEDNILTGKNFPNEVFVAKCLFRMFIRLEFWYTWHI